MSGPKSLGELARFARETGITQELAQPFQDVMEDMDISEEDERHLQALCLSLRARTLLQALRHPRVDAALEELVSPTRAAALRASLYGHFLEYAGVDDDDFDPSEYDPDRVPDALLQHADRAPQPVVGPMAAVPLELDKVRLWATEHGVAERLADPIKVLVPFVYVGDAYVASVVTSGGTVVDAFAPPPPLPARAPRWEAGARMNSAASLASAARQYLQGVARVRAVVLARRRALDRRARPPAEPSLVALLARIEAARAELATRVQPRPIGTYEPKPAQVEEAPLRIVYVEGANLHYEVHLERVVIPVEEEPLRVVCSCPAAKQGPCPHALDALDAAVDLLRDPDGDARKLAAVLAVPVWQRFFRAFSDELTRREAPAAPADVRLAWRVGNDGAKVTVEPLLQKRLKGGGWSHGGRVRADDVAEQRGLLADPHDARVYQALTMGLEDPSVAFARPSGRRTFHVLEALIGHPRVYLEGRAGTPARVSRERLRVALEAGEAGVLVSFFFGARRRDAGALLALASGGDQLVVVDAEAGAVALGTLDERALALLAAFAKHPARFPPESHDDLLRGLVPLQESVDLVLPEALAGEPVDGDARPVVRLSPRDTGEVEVEVLVRPVEGGPVFRPGEGPAAVLHALHGRRVTARRDLAREASGAAAVVAHLAPGHVVEGGDDAAWSALLAEEEALDLLAALRDLGEAVVVEWPEPDKRLSLASSLTRKELRIRVVDRRDWFGVEGEVEVDGTSIPLAALLDAVRRGRRYVRVAQGRFAAIEDELRQRASAADDVLHPGRKGLEVALPGVGTIEDLVDGAGHLQAASRWRELVGRLDAARALEPELPPGLEATLRPYQAEGFRWLTRLAAWGAGACLADDMGLGKTVQALALLLARAGRGPALVIAPTSVGPNWIREAERFAPGLRARLYRGPGRAALLAEAIPGDVLVTSYALAVRDAEALGRDALRHARARRGAGHQERAHPPRARRRRPRRRAPRRPHRHPRGEPPGRAVEPDARAHAGAAGELGSLPRALRRPHRARPRSGAQRGAVARWCGPSCSGAPRRRWRRSSRRAPRFERFVDLSAAERAPLRRRPPRRARSRWRRAAATRASPSSRR